MTNATDNQNEDDSFAEFDQEKVHNSSNLVYKITINNSKEGGQAVRFKIKFSAKDRNEQINIQWPRSGVKGQARHSEREQIAILMPKINPHDDAEDINKLNIEFFVKEIKADESAGANNNQQQSSSANEGKTVSFNDNVTTVATTSYGP